MSDYLEQCVKRFSCDDANSVAKIPSGYSFAPFVELKLGDEIVTVGDNSRPGKGNTAVIKSLDYGVSQGQGCKIEIYDEEGGSFSNAFQALSKSIEKAESDMNMFELDFGWLIEERCGSQTSIRKISASNSSGQCGKLYLLPLRANVSYEGGKIKYQIEAQDMMARVGEARVECNIGTDKRKTTLKNALIKLFKELKGGPICDVEFKSSDGKKPFEFSVGGRQGPKGVWNSNQQNKLATARRWVSDYTTKNGKGILFQWKGCGDPTIIIMEDPGPTMNEVRDPCLSNISSVTGKPGTYVVNGGPDSSVISFSPTVNWHLSKMGKSGGQQGAFDGSGAKAKGKKVRGLFFRDKTGDGGAMTDPGTSNLPPGLSPKESTKKVQASRAAHQRANMRIEAMSTIEGELKIFGDPSLVFPYDIVSKNLSLIVINPFHIKNSSSDNCGDWLVSPPCNDVFSNKNWLILGVNHQITPGSYVTILKISLPAPGVDLEPDDVVGGSGSGGSPIFNTVTTNPKDNDCEVK
jgi:hypothetical protein